MKIVMSEVTTAKTSIESSKSKLQGQINSAKSSWKGVVSSNGLSGSVKTAIDAQINNYQMPLLTNYYDAMHQLSTEFEKAINDFKSTVKETSGSAIIDTDALTTAESKFSEQLTKYTEIESKIKTIYSSIDDLVSVSAVSGSGFTEEMEKTKKVLTNTKNWMAAFNGKKSSKAISSILSQQKSQINSLKGVAGLRYDDSKALTIYQNKAFKKNVSKQHKKVTEFEKKKMIAEQRAIMRTHPAILGIDGRLDNEYNAKVVEKINDNSHNKKRSKKKEMVLIKETDSNEEIYQKYIYFSKKGLHPYTGKKLTEKEKLQFTYAAWSGSATEIGGVVGGAYFGEKAAKYNFSKGNYSTKIDSKVIEVKQANLPESIKNTFTDGNYRTVETLEDVKVYRTYGGKAKQNGGYATTSPAKSRIDSKIDSALLPEWGNSRKYEIEITIPKGQQLNIGKVAPQTIEGPGTKLSGGADQVLLPKGWSSKWITNTRTVPSK